MPDKADEPAAIPLLPGRLGADGGRAGALASIHAIATNPTVAGVIRASGADDMLAVKANLPTLRAEVEAAFVEAAPATPEHRVDVDKGHGRVEQRSVAVLRKVDWLTSDRRFPRGTRLPAVAAIVPVETVAQLGKRSRTDTRYLISCAALTAERTAEAARGQWGIENRLHGVLDVLFGNEQLPLRTGHGATNMAVVKHFALNLVRAGCRQETPENTSEARRLE